MPEQGSSFRIVIALPIADQSADEQSPEEPLPNSEPLDILIIDDVALNRELLRRLLIGDGHRVTEAADGAAAMTAAGQMRFDLILMDTRAHEPDTVTAHSRYKVCTSGCTVPSGYR
jgi:PleD family two-component response regulator